MASHPVTSNVLSERFAGRRLAERESMDQQLTDDFGWQANAVVAALTFIPSAVTNGQAPVRTLVAVLAHADDEAPVAPSLARYATILRY